jgi:hypothetical protein
MTRLYEDNAELYDIAFDWDISDEADWLVERLAATTVLEPGCRELVAQPQPARL